MSTTWTDINGKQSDGSAVFAPRSSKTGASRAAAKSDTLRSAAKRLIIQAMQLKDFGHEGSDGDFRTNASKTALLEECAEKAARAVLDLVIPAAKP
ncbi:hypothetical protein NKJ88_05890 [Mesorhizobium sp. M0016]|uniref:hypothetical protein n=1 Tax=Mesorhizobium sp. M0016 TaxID=2956843 RepID=UPI00333BBE0A